MIFEEKLIESERIYEGRILNLRRDKVTTVTGSSYREIVEHNGAVAMVVLTDEGNIIMERQYRYACKRAVRETNPQAAAERELKEETGYTASEIIYLGGVNPSCAYSEEVIHLYLMRGLSKGEQELDDDEVIEIVEMPFDEVYDMAVRGEIADSKTLAALLMAKGRLQE